MSGYSTHNDLGLYGAPHFIQSGAVGYANDEDTDDAANSVYQLIIPDHVCNSHNGQPNWEFDLPAL